MTSKWQMIDVRPSGPQCKWYCIKMNAKHKTSTVQQQTDVPLSEGHTTQNNNNNNKKI